MLQTGPGITNPKMQIKIAFFLLFAVSWTVNSIHAIRSYYVVPSNSSDCNSEFSTYEACFTFQQFAERSQNESYYHENITLTFAPGRHLLLGGIEFSNAAHVIVKGQMKNSYKPEISCFGGNCFSLRNLSSLHIENLGFTECLSEASDGSAIFTSGTNVVNITQCSFVNNIAHMQGGAVRLEFIESVHMLQNQFLNNSAICPQSEIHSVSGNCSTSCNTSGGALSFFHISSLVIDTLLFDGNVASCHSGAIALSFSNASILNSRFIRNGVAVNDGFGGGLFLNSSALKLQKSTFEENDADTGGGIYSVASTLDIFDSAFSLNSAGYSGGGAAFFINTTLSIENTIFRQNSAHRGGAIAIDSVNQHTLIVNSTFQNNTLRSLGDFGGAVFLQLSGVPNCTSSCNKEVIPTGNESTVTVTASTFQSNYGGLTGGAISVRGGVLNVTDNDFSGNRAQVGGAIDCSLNFAFLQENKFANNSAKSAGGALSLIDEVLQSKNNVYSNNECRFANGGVIFASNATLVSMDDQYNANKANAIGGAIFVVDSDVSSIGSVYSNNNGFFNGGRHRKRSYISKNKRSLKSQERIRRTTGKTPRTRK